MIKNIIIIVKINQLKNTTKIYNFFNTNKKGSDFLRSLVLGIG